jgi:hypothetical protein
MRPQRRRAASTIAARGGLVGNVRFERKAFATRLSCHCDRFLGGGEVVVDCQHLGAFLCKAQNRGTAVAQAFARRLTGAQYDGDLILETDANLGGKQHDCRSTEFTGALVDGKVHALGAVLNKRTSLQRVGPMAGHLWFDHDEARDHRDRGHLRHP